MEKSFNTKITQDLRPELRQELRPTLELRVLLHLLHLPLSELETAISQEIQQNPFLEARGGREESFDEIISEIETIRERQFRVNTYERAIADTGEDSFRIEDIPAGGKSIYQHIQEQIGLMNFEPEERILANAIVAYIDRNGFLIAEDEEIAKELEVDVEKVKGVLEKMKKNIEPSGLICKDIRERLKIQSEERGGDEIVMKIIDSYLKHVERGRIKEIAEKLGVDEEKVLSAVNFIKQLDPRPERIFETELNRYVVPDAILKVNGDELELIVQDGNIPELRVNSALYRSLKEAMEKGDESAKKEIEFMFRRAKGFCRLKIERKRMLEKVIRELLEYNRDYFTGKCSFLKPLTIQELAEKVGVHKSTLSRMVANKYIDTPTGVYPLRRFFTSKLKRVDGGCASSDYVKKRIKSIIESENPKKPLSDQAIADILRGEGIWIARRTVAKYREEMGIPSSGRRGRSF